MVSIELSSRVYPGFAVVSLVTELETAGAGAAAVVLPTRSGPGRP